jgi:(p)ppGpp synthase/HD superfamily hydrolase
MSDLVRRAEAFAAKAHEGQKRKYTGEPYIVHPQAVAEILAEAGLDDEVIAAGLMHDVVEDCDVTVEDIRAAFGDRVAQLVDEVTDVSRPEDGNRAIRKGLDRDHLAKASPEAKSVKLADIIDNTRSIVPYDPSFARVYMREMRLLLPMLKEGNPALFKRATAALHDSNRSDAGSAPKTG